MTDGPGTSAAPLIPYAREVLADILIATRTRFSEAECLRFTRERQWKTPFGFGEAAHLVGFFFPLSDYVSPKNRLDALNDSLRATDEDSVRAARRRLVALAHEGSPWIVLRPESNKAIFDRWIDEEVNSPA